MWSDSLKILDVLRVEINDLVYNATYILFCYFTFTKQLSIRSDTDLRVN